MNPILQLKGSFESKKRNIKFAITIPENEKYDISHVKNILKQLEDAKMYWKDNKYSIPPLLDIHYKKIIAKSQRLSKLFYFDGKSPNSYIVGSRYNDDKTYHIVKYCITFENLDSTINNLKIVINYLEANDIKIINRGVIDELSEIKGIDNSKEFKELYGLAKTCVIQILLDCNYINKIDFEYKYSEELNEEAIITLYNVGIPLKDLMKKIGINVSSEMVWDNTSVLLTPEQFTILKNNAPYLISMGVTDLSLIAPIQFTQVIDKKCTIKKPTNEPTIGVIDTLCDVSNAYFSDWVTYEDRLTSNLTKSEKDYMHGTAITSLIVDGPKLNPKHEDGCGNFKVKHFGVSVDGKMSSFLIISEIKKIISENRNIKVWNLSLGSPKEIDDNYISIEASLLDKLQNDYDIVFVVAGTNNDNLITKDLKLGAPADSINSIVVNAVDSNGKYASYSRHGGVLTYFTKPDLCTFGGDDKNEIYVYTPKGIKGTKGTSFAAPWITRKMAYLIEVLGFTRETAKALLIDSAKGWKSLNDDKLYYGHGIVPNNINEIIKSKNDEIKFMINGTIQDYETYNHNIPVPIYKGSYPYIAKATLCYFPTCSRNQGVDYTNTELDLHFGRVTEKEILTLNNNKQQYIGFHNIPEKDAIKLFGKWDNVKHIGEFIKTRIITKKVYNNFLWGIRINAIDRLNNNDKKDLRFGLVVTLKAVDGVNRIEQFIKNCYFKQWLVAKIEVENSIDIYNKLTEEVSLE